MGHGFPHDNPTGSGDIECVINCVFIGHLNSFQELLGIHSGIIGYSDCNAALVHGRYIGLGLHSEPTTCGEVAP